MTAHYRASDAERAGAALGRACRKLRQQERRLIMWLASRGWSARAITFLVRALQLTVFGVLLFTAFWVALLLLFVLIAAWTVRNTDWDDDRQPELRDGHSGVGLYDKDDWRIDMGDPEQP